MTDTDFPKFCRIGFRNFKIIMQPFVCNTETNKNECVNGLFDNDSGKILVVENLEISLKKQVLFHEILHLIDKMYELDMTERQIEVMSAALMQFCQDNKNIVDLFSEVKNGDDEAGNNL